MKKKYVAFVIIIMSVAIVFNLITTQEFFKDKFNIHFDKKGNTNSFININSEDGYYYSKYFKVNSSNWNNLKLDNSSFDGIEEFLIYIDDLVDRITDYSKFDELDYNRKTQINFNDSEFNSLAMNIPKNNLLSIEKNLFENNTYCFEKDIYLLFLTNEVNGLDIGYGYYLNAYFKNNIVYPNYGVDIDVYVANKIVNHNGYDIKKYNEIISSPNILDAESIENYISVNCSFVKFMIDNYGFDNFQMLLKSDNRERAMYEIYGKESFELMAIYVESLKNTSDYIHMCKELIIDIDEENIEEIGSKDFKSKYNGDYYNKDLYTLNFSFNAYIFKEYGARKFSALEKYNYDYYLIYDKSLENLKNDWVNEIENYIDIVKK